MILLGIDIESSGLDKKKDRITEIGLALFDTDFKDPSCEYIPVEIFNKIIKEPDCPKIHPEVYELTHISKEMLDRWGIKPDKRFCEYLSSFINKADYIVAANGRTFDKPMLESFFKRYGATFPDKVWIDTQKDITYPKSCHHVNQVYLAGFFGTHNPMPHRSVTDVIMMMKLMGAYDANGLLFPLDTIIKNSTAQKVCVRAVVSYDDRELAKSDKFKWDGDGSECGRAKTWFKEMNDFDYDSDNYPFKTEMLPEKK